MESMSKQAVLLVSTLLCLAASPGQGATILRGYVSQDHELTQADSGAAGNQKAPSFSVEVQSNSFPSGYEGSWHCISVVTDSAVDSVKLGEQIISDINFQRCPDGRVTAHWNQPGWTETESAITSWNSFDSMIDRTSYYFGEKMNGGWAARSRDQFQQTKPDEMVAQSYVDQYIDGQYLGRYRTKSVLRRTANTLDVALSNK